LMQDYICQIDEFSCDARPDHTFGSNRGRGTTAADHPVRSTGRIAAGQMRHRASATRWRRSQHARSKQGRFGSSES
jgi:hypothetical protein